MKTNHTEASELGDFLGNTAKSAMIGKIIAAPLKYVGDAWTKFSLANPNYYVPAEFGSAVAKLDYLDEIASGQLTTTSSRVAAQTTAAGLRKEIILKSGMDKSEILKFFGDGDDILAIIDEMDNVVGVEGGLKGTLNGSLDKLTQAERTMVDDLLNKGKNVEIIPRSDLQSVKTPDFKVDGILTELKSLSGTSMNTPVTRIQKGFGQGASTVIIDGRGNGLTVEQANTVLDRINGIYKDGIPGKIEIWIFEGIIYGGK